MGRQAVLPPVVDDIDPRPAVNWLVMPVHVVALNCGAEAAGGQMLISLLPRHVRAGEEIWHAGGAGESLARSDRHATGA